MIEISKASKSLGGNSILKDITLKVDTKSIFGLIGENGAGKSTNP